MGVELRLSWGGKCQYGLKMFENWVHRRMFGFLTEQVTNWRKGINRSFIICTIR